jgi:hypothetical protein
MPWMCENFKHEPLLRFGSELLMQMCCRTCSDPDCRIRSHISRRRDLNEALKTHEKKMSVIHSSRATGVSHLVEKAQCSPVATDPSWLLPNDQSPPTQKPNKLMSSSAADRVCVQHPAHHLCGSHWLSFFDNSLRCCKLMLDCVLLHCERTELRMFF